MLARVGGGKGRNSRRDRTGILCWQGRDIGRLGFRGRQRSRPFVHMPQPFPLDAPGFDGLRFIVQLTAAPLHYRGYDDRAKGEEHAENNKDESPDGFHRSALRLDTRGGA